MKKYILFDNDGVLVDTEYWYYRAGERGPGFGRRAARSRPIPQGHGAGLGTWHQAILAGVDEATIDRLKLLRNEYYQHSLRTEAIEIDGVVDVLAELARHVSMAIVTTSKRADFDLIHADRGILQYMDFVLARDDYAQPKPHPEPYLTALERFGATKAETLIVEDSARGLRSAVAAGIDCAVVHNDFTQTQDFSGATHRIDTLRELPDLVR